MTFISIVKGEKFPQAHFAHVQISPMKFDVMTNRGQLVFNVTFVWAALLLFTTKNVHLFAHKILKAKISPFSTSWMWPHLYSVTLWAKCCCFFLHNFFMINNSMSQMLSIELNIFDLEYSLSYRYWVWCFALYGPIKKWYMVLRKAITSIISWQNLIERNPVSIEICVIWSFV